MNYDEESKQHTLSIKFKFPLFDDQFDWLKNKDGSYKRDKLGRRIGKVSEGKTKLNNHLTLDYRFDSCKFNVHYCIWVSYYYYKHIFNHNKGH